MRISADTGAYSEAREYREHAAMPNSSLFRKNAVGALLLLLLSLALTFWLLLPNAMDSFKEASRSQSIASWLFITAGGFVIGFLIGFPAVLLIRCAVDYRLSRDLERFGLMTKGSLVKKWVETSENSTPVYRVRYEYLTYLSAVQTVGEETYTQISHDETLFVLYLENLPHISRLDLE